MCSLHISLLVVTSPPHISSWVSTLNYSTKDFQSHARTHYVVIIVIVAIVAMLTLYDSPSFTQHTKLLSSRIHVNPADLLNNMCTLVATNVTLGKLECKRRLLDLGASPTN